MSVYWNTIAGWKNSTFFFITWGTIANERYVFSWLTSVGEHSYFYGTWGSRGLRFSLGAVSFHWLPWWLSGRESTCNAEDAGLIPGSGRSPGRGHGNHSSILAWRIPWTEEPDGLQPMELQRVRYNGSDWARHSIPFPHVLHWWKHLAYYYNIYLIKNYLLCCWITKYLWKNILVIIMSCDIVWVLQTTSCEQVVHNLGV